MKELVITGITIRTDAEGRYCLNDLHKAAGGLSKDKPSDWLILKGIKELREEMETSGITEIKTIDVRVGRYGGTYVVKELVYAYAMWISPKFHLQVIRAYDELMSVKTAPPGEYDAIKDDMVDYTRTVAAAVKLARVFGLSGNQAYLSADISVKKLTGVSPLKLIEHELIAPSKEKLLTPTEIGKILSISNQRINAILVDMGFQKSYTNTSGGKSYTPTKLGEPYAVLIDTTKRHVDGAPIQQIKWYEGVISEIENHLSTSIAKSA